MPSGLPRTSSSSSPVSFPPPVNLDAPFGPGKSPAPTGCFKSINNNIFPLFLPPRPPPLYFAPPHSALPLLESNSIGFSGTERKPPILTRLPRAVGPVPFPLFLPSDLSLPLHRSLLSFSGTTENSDRMDSSSPPYEIGQPLPFFRRLFFSCPLILPFSMPASSSSEEMNSRSGENQSIAFLPPVLDSPPPLCSSLSP